MAIFLVRIVDDFVKDVFELAAIVVKLIVLKNLSVVFRPFGEQILSTFRAVEGRVTVAVKDDVYDCLKTKISKILGVQKIPEGRGYPESFDNNRKESRNHRKSLHHRHLKMNMNMKNIEISRLPSNPDKATAINDF